MKSLVMKQNIIQKYQQIQAVLDEDLKVTLSHLEMEEHAAVSALDSMMEKNRSLIQEIEQDLIRLSLSINQIQTEKNKMVITPNSTILKMKYDFKEALMALLLTFFCQSNLNICASFPWFSQVPEDREQVLFYNQVLKTACHGEIV